MLRTTLRRFYSSKQPAKPYRTPPPRSRPPAEPLAEHVAESQPATQNGNSWRDIARRTGHYTLVAAIVLTWGHLFAKHVFAISSTYGASMLPTMEVAGEWVLVNKMYRRGKDVKVGDIICADHPLFLDQPIMKRVIGMPGDFVLADSVDTSGRMIQVPRGHCFIAGDNEPHSRDSRNYGPIPLALIKGKATWKLLPTRNFGRLGNTLEQVEEAELD